MRLEIGAGERPDPDYGVHTDVLPFPGIQDERGIPRWIWNAVVYWLQRGHHQRPRGVDGVIWAAN